MKANYKMTVLALAVSAAMISGSALARDRDNENRSANINHRHTVTDIRLHKDVDVDVDLALDASARLRLDAEHVERTSNEKREKDNHGVDVNVEKDIRLSSDINFSGAPTVGGHIDFDSAAIALIDNRQTVTNNQGYNEQLDNTASIADEVSSSASGNLQFNVAAGDNNVQDNAAALSAADASFSFGMADAEIFVNQMGAGNVTGNLGVANDASIGGNAFASASGNIGVNVTSGNNNTQKNALAASVATSAYAQSTISSNQTSTGNAVANAPLEREYFDTVEIGMSGRVSGGTVALGAGGYSGTASGSTSSQGESYQMANFYLDTWNGELPHTNGTSTGHIDMDREIQNAKVNPWRGNGSIGGIAFDSRDTGTYQGSEEGNLGFVELGYADLLASLSGTLEIKRYEVVADATNNASLSGSAFSAASGNIGVNVSAGTGNLQANSLAMAVAQPSTGGGGGGGTGE